MSTRPTSLIFMQAPPFLPAGAPLEPYEVIADTNCTFEVDARGLLIKKDRVVGTRWISPDYTGSFTITNVPKYSQEPHMYLMFIVCGVITHMHRVAIRTPANLSSGEWLWTLEALAVDAEAARSAKTYVGCLQLIQDAEMSAGYRSGDERLDCMIGMALCRPELLQGKSARNALQCLDDHQLRAISAWHRAQLPD